MNSDLRHLELYTMESGEELMLLSNVLRKAVLLGGHLNKRNLPMTFGGRQRFFQSYVIQMLLISMVWSPMHWEL